MAEAPAPGRDQPRGGVIFDVDGTLLDTNYLHVTAWWQAFRERGHDVACADIHRATGRLGLNVILATSAKDEDWT